MVSSGVQSVLGGGGGIGGGCSITAARCLFGPPDVKSAKDLVKDSVGQSIFGGGGGIGVGGGGCGRSRTARCLFGPPDVKSAKDLVKEVELRNALNFGKRYNFDIVNGEPFPHAKKKMKMSHDYDYDSVLLNNNENENNLENEENVAKVKVEELSGSDLELDEKRGYIWSETYDQDYMAMCNNINNKDKDSIMTQSSLVAGLNRHPMSLLSAPIIVMKKKRKSTITDYFQVRRKKNGTGTGTTIAAANANQTELGKK